ncbi:putative transcription elongation factor SPT5 homolog 2 isoform X4 [Hevea brasiliensis]|uniref:putative transcription elongation factor SPT5 homolog 2 isoform X4 n=1 Tax=Hevea brasiliensis TaxID=3981 RepID=UPI000B782B6D|nr:putative transcription elongation factor SPT5 homolog 2 isoform X4 [Hevea brasiliensis]
MRRWLTPMTKRRKKMMLRTVADVDNVQRGVRVTLIPQIDSQAIANKLDGGEEVKKVAFVPPCFVNGDEARLKNRSNDC